MKIHVIRSTTVIAGLFAIAFISHPAQAQKEFPPPQGKGRVVVVCSGQSGMDHYEKVTRAIADLGYDAVLFDGNTLAGTKGEALKTAIQQALQMPHALPGKVGIVGFSMGGGTALGYGPRWADQVATVVVWYPATTVFTDIPGYVRQIQVPVLMFAGESDTYKNCCLIETAHKIANEATAAGKPFELITYPKTDHDFVDGGSHYNSKSYKDALDRTAARLKESLSK